MKKFLFLSISVLTVSLLACSKEKGTQQQSPKTSPSAKEIQSRIEKATNENKLNIELTVKRGTKVTLNPRTFIEIAILFSLDSIKWRQELAERKKKNPNINVEEFLAQKRQAFYKQFGITEKEYNLYGSKHSKEIAEFTSKHPELMEEFNRLQLPQNY